MTKWTNDINIYGFKPSAFLCKINSFNTHTVVFVFIILRDERMKDSFIRIWEAHLNTLHYYNKRKKKPTQ